MKQTMSTGERFAEIARSKARQARIERERRDAMADRLRADPFAPEAKA